MNDRYGWNPDCLNPSTAKAVSTTMSDPLRAKVQSFEESIYLANLAADCSSDGDPPLYFHNVKAEALELLDGIDKLRDFQCHAARMSHQHWKSKGAPNHAAMLERIRAAEANITVARYNLVEALDAAAVAPAGDNSFRLGVPIFLHRYVDSVCAHSLEAVGVAVGPPRSGSGATVCWWKD